MAPPGVSFWAQVLPTLAAPPILVYALVHILDDKDVLHLPFPWLKAFLCLLATPFYLYAKSCRTDLSNRRLARKHGAKLFPPMATSLPGGIDILYRMLMGLKYEYAGNGFNEMLSNEGKTVVLQAMGETRLLTKEPRYIKHILTGNFSNYVKGEQLFGSATRSVLGTGVFNADGDLWKFHRSLTRPFFSRDRISDFQIFTEHADEVIQKMKESFQSGLPVDFQDVSARFTLDSATEFLFGDCVHSIAEPFLLPGGVSQTQSNTSSSAFVRAFGAAQEVISRRLRVGEMWPALETFKDESAPHTKHIGAYLQPIIDKGLERQKMLRESQIVGDEKKGVQEGMTFLDYLMLETDDVNIIRDSLMNMLIAGRDTTASLLTFATYALSQHPEILVKLRNEILQVVGPSKIPTYEDIRELKYLRAIINETLRLWPPVPLDYRETIKPDVWTAEDGTRYFIPAKMCTAYSVISMHRDTSLWGDDALEFDPMRWLDERLAHLTANPFKFLPFNAGPRICLGQQFAYNEASFFLIRLLQTFDSITLRPDAQPAGSLPNSSGTWDLSQGRNGREKVWPRTHLTMYVERGMWVAMGDSSPTSVDTEIS